MIHPQKEMQLSRKLNFSALLGTFPNFPKFPTNFRQKKQEFPAGKCLQNTMKDIAGYHQEVARSAKKSARKVTFLQESAPLRASSRLEGLRGAFWRHFPEESGQRKCLRSTFLPKQGGTPRPPPDPPQGGVWGGVWGG